MNGETGSAPGELVNNLGPGDLLLPVLDSLQALA